MIHAILMSLFLFCILFYAIILSGIIIKLIKSIISKDWEYFKWELCNLIINAIVLTALIAGYKLTI